MACEDIICTNSTWLVQVRINLVWHQIMSPFRGTSPSLSILSLAPAHLSTLSMDKGGSNEQNPESCENHLQWILPPSSSTSKPSWYFCRPSQHALIRPLSILVIVCLARPIASSRDSTSMWLQQNCGFCCSRKPCARSIVPARVMGLELQSFGLQEPSQSRSCCTKVFVAYERSRPKQTKLWYTAFCLQSALVSAAAEWDMA